MDEMFRHQMKKKLRVHYLIAISHGFAPNELLGRMSVENRGVYILHKKNMF